MDRIGVWMLCCLGLVPAHDSLAHPVEPCLARLSQLSVTLKDCELHQVEEGQCGSSRARLDAQIARMAKIARMAELDCPDARMAQIARIPMASGHGQ